jgi:hypothetical protein
MGWGVEGRGGAGRGGMGRGGGDHWVVGWLLGVTAHPVYSNQFRSPCINLPESLINNQVMSFDQMLLHRQAIFVAVHSGK